MQLPSIANKRFKSKEHFDIKTTLNLDAVSSKTKVMIT